MSLSNIKYELESIFYIQYFNNFININAFDVKLFKKLNILRINLQKKTKIFLNKKIIL